MASDITDVEYKDPAEHREEETGVLCIQTYDRKKLKMKKHKREKRRKRMRNLLKGSGKI